VKYWKISEDCGSLFNAWAKRFLSGDMIVTKDEHNDLQEEGDVDEKDELDAAEEEAECETG